MNKSRLRSPTGRAPLILAALGIISGVLTNLAYVNIDAIRPDTSQYGPIVSDGITALMTGIFFAALVCFAMSSLTKTTKLRIAAAFVSTILAWRLAYGTAITVYDWLDSDLIGDSSVAFLKDVRTEIAGLLGGFVGSLVTVGGVSFALNDFRSWRPWGTTILVGSISGIVLGLEERLHLQWGNLALFVIWQAAVGVSIGSVLADTNPSSA